VRPTKQWWLVVAIGLGGCECGERGSPVTPASTEPADPTAPRVTAPLATSLPPVRADVAPKCRTICRIAGRCTLEPTTKECFAERDEDCQQSRGCLVNGMCTAQGGLCHGTRDEDCRRSARCKDEGLCSLAGGDQVTATNCIAKTDADCAGSKTCVEQRRCKAIGDRCDDPENPIKGPPLAAPP
jgi:hypothetical protein